MSVNQYIPKVPEKWCRYSQKPAVPSDYTNKMNKVYTRFAKAYDAFIQLAPFWRKWLSSVLPYIKGKRLLEISFGPAWLMLQYPSDKYLYGLDYNETMVYRAKVKLLKAKRKGKIHQGDVADMPYPDNHFHTIVNTMAFSGYPDGKAAMDEMLRVLKPGGVLLLLDYDYPEDRNLFGYLMVRFIELCGDIMKDIKGLLDEYDVEYRTENIGAFGSVQLFIIRK